MTEEQAISEIQEHINSGRLLVLRMPPQYLIQPPCRFPRFYWGKRNGEFAWVNFPVALTRELTEAEARENWCNSVGHFPAEDGPYFEAVLD